MEPSGPGPSPSSLREGDALLVVNVQNDLLPGGALAIPGADEVVPVLDEWLAACAARGHPVVVVRDWHPAGHCSFHAQGGALPAHCIADTWGAATPAGLRIPPDAVVLSRGVHESENACSAFQIAALRDQLRAMHVLRLFVGGLGSDDFIRRTVEDGIAAGFAVVVLKPALRVAHAPAHFASWLASVRHQGALVRD